MTPAEIQVSIAKLQEQMRAARMYQVAVKDMDDVRNDTSCLRMYDDDMWAECKPAVLRVLQRRVDAALAEMEKLGVTP